MVLRRAAPARPCRTALVLGGSSDLGLATVRALAADGLEQVVLACREPDALRSRLSADPLPIPVTCEQWDALATEDHAGLLARAAATLGEIDLVLCTVGSLGHGSGLTASPAEVESLLAANLTGPAAALTAAARHLVAQGHGALVVLTSVAGLRARKSNYVYGAAKAGLDTFASGLADALVGTGVHVHLVRPGFVHTRMTTGLPPAPFASDPAAVADAITAALRRPQSTITHVPRLLGPLFGAFRLAPRPVWRRIAGDR